MKLAAQKRDGTKAAKLRAQGKIPAVVYNKELNIPISVDLKSFDRVFREQGTGSLIELELDGSSHDVLVKQVQMNKRRREPMHADFYAVTAGQPVQVHVPIEFTGNAEGVKAGGLLDVQRREVLISIIPRLIPHGLTVDVSALKIGDSLHLYDIKAQLPPEADILDDLELTLIALVPPRVEEEPEPLEEEAEPELIGKGKEDEDTGGDDSGG